MASPTGPSGVTESLSASHTKPSAGPTGASSGEPSSPSSYGTFGMAVFLLALAVLFAANMVAYLMIRIRSETWPPPYAPPLPAGLWVSTILILLCSTTIHWARQGIAADHQRTLRAALILTFVFGVLFLASQTHNWFELAAAYTGTRMDLYAFTFYMLTSLHAAHVIGGLVLLAVVAVKAFLGRYTAQYHPGVRYAAMYWHFLDVVWLILFTVMYVAD